MTCYVVRECVTANFGTLSGWSKDYYKTEEEARKNCSGFGFIETAEIDEKLLNEIIEYRETQKKEKEKILNGE